LNEQNRALKAAGVEHIFREQTASAGGREMLDRAIEFANNGDTLIVTDLVRVARCLSHLAELLERLKRKIVSLRVLRGNIDTATPDGRAIKGLLAPLAQFHQELRDVRRLEGIAKAKAEGKYRGRGLTARSQGAAIILLKKSGKSTSSIVQALGISISSVNRIWKFREVPLGNAQIAG
jgi:DNA invertase Pin-like site-specific DNA recombinase